MKKDPKMILCLLCVLLFFFSLFISNVQKPAETLSAILAWTPSLTHSPSLSLALSLLLSLKEAAFCDLQIEAGHVTPGGLSITRPGRPTSRLKGTAPSLHRRDNSPPSNAALTRSPLAWFFSVPHAKAIIHRKGKTGEAWVWRATQLELLSLKLAKKREANYANSTIRLQNPLTVNDECVSITCHTVSSVVHCGTLDPSPQPEEKPHFKNYPIPIPGQEEVHLQSKMKTDCDQTLHDTHI